MNVTPTYGQHADVSWRVLERTVSPSLHVLRMPADLCVLHVRTADASDTAVLTAVRDRKAVAGASIDGAFAGTRAWSPPS